MKRPFVTEIIDKLAVELNAELIIEPEYNFAGCIVFANGRRTFFWDTKFDINPQSAAALAKDKAYTSFFLEKFGYSTLPCRTFFREDFNRKLKVKRGVDEGFAYSQQLGLPVIVKPNDLGQGSFVTKVHNKREYYMVARKIFSESSILLIQKFYAGRDYRIIVLNKKIHAAYERSPLSIVGNGKATVEELIHRKLGAETTKYRVIDVSDYRIDLKLKRQTLGRASVPEPGEEVVLLDNANLSSGGEAADVTDIIHKDFADLAVRVVNSFGLRFCGVDILTGNITQSLDKQPDGYRLLEINESPGLDNYAALGDLQKQRVEGIYFDILKTLEGTLW